MSEKKDARARILIVEDELIIAQNLKYRLEKLGYEVTGITIDAGETRAALEKVVPDLVLMDIALYGGNDGVILAKWIDKNYKIPVIYVTSHTDNTTFKRASTSMPYGYLIKPFNPKELYNTIELALQRHKLQLQLSSSSNLLGSVLQSISDAIVVADKNRNVLYMNVSAEQLLGTRFSEVRNKKVDEILSIRNFDSSITAGKWNLEDLPDDEEPDFETRLDTGGRTRYLNVRLLPLRSSAHQDISEGFLFILRDITHRRKTENIILQIATAVSGELGNAFLQTLTEHLSTTLEMDYCLLGEINDDDPGQCIIAAASAGANAPEHEFRPFRTEGTPAGEILRTGKTLCFEKGVRDRFPDDHNLNSIDIQGYAGTPLITSGGKKTGVIIVMSSGKLEDTEILKSVLQIFANRATAEIERRRYEKKLIEERNRANEMNTLKNNFLSNLSHEVRTPLNSIIGFASLLSEELENKEQLEFLSFIEEGGQRLLQTINDLLILSIMESEPDKLKPVKINLESDIVEAVGIMQNDARDKNIDLNYTIKSENTVVLGDPGMVGQVLRKLIGNAIKFTDKGSVSIETDHAELNNRKYGVFRIRDSGVGIDKNFLPQVFDEFKQESRGMARKFEGVGLGLTIAKKMVTLMDGKIDVESIKGKGSTFTVYLPLADEQTPRIPSEIQPPEKLDKTSGNPE